MWHSMVGAEEQQGSAFWLRQQGLGKANVVAPAGQCRGKEADREG